MYEAHFGLFHRPFSSVPRTDHYFPGASIEAARQTLVRCVQRGEGAGMLIGPSGTGKTLLCQLLAEGFRNTLRVALLSRGSGNTPRALLQAILYELGLPYRGLEDGELRLSLVERLTKPDNIRGMLLLVDEAHRLPLRLLEEIRTLTNLVAEGQPCVRLVLAGSRALEERLASPKLESFSQRVVARCYLEALNRTETQGYIHAQLSAVGGQGPELFPPEACQSVHRATDGVPRLINQLCDHALLLALTGGRKQVDAACVEEAWADLQQLPTPWNGESPSAPTERNVIEFGGLSDEDEPVAEPAEAAEAAESEDSPSDTLPMLRLRQEEDTGVEPLEQLRHIEDTLSELDDEFRPAGSIEPEVELVFADPGNPFSEMFEEEEVVVERYALPCRVAAEAAVAPAMVSAAAAGAASRLDDAPQADSRIELSRPAGSNVPPADNLAGAGDDRGSPPAIEEIGSEEDDACRTVPMRRESAPETTPPDDSDMIVVEEGYEDTPVPPARPVAPVRQHDYRRLFARLRHG